MHQINSMGLSVAMVMVLAFFFAITTDDCPCATRFFYNPDNCLC